MCFELFSFLNNIQFFVMTVYLSTAYCCIFSLWLLLVPSSVNEALCITWHRVTMYAIKCGSCFLQVNKQTTSQNQALHSCNHMQLPQGTELYIYQNYHFNSSLNSKALVCKGGHRRSKCKWPTNFTCITKIIHHSKLLTVSRNT